MKLINGKFFPFPIFLNVRKKFDNYCIKGKKVELFFQKKKVCDFIIEEKFYLNAPEKKKYSKKLFKTNKKSHPGFKRFMNEEGIFLSGKILNFNDGSLKNINFSKPILIKKKLINLNKIVGFHTRNIPHKGHEWIHELGIKKCKNILIQPIVGHFKKGEYTEKAVIEANKYLVQKKNNQFKKRNINSKYFFSFINIQPKYAGPREALLHALIRKNYGCTHFLVGRDHAGFKNFYEKYDSQKLCKKYEKELKIKIIVFSSPKICLICKKITNNKCECSTFNPKNLIDINGSYIRKLIKNKKKVPNYLLNDNLINKISNKNILH